MDSQATLIFVRHAAIECSRNGSSLLCGRYDAPLSREGCRQVDCLRQRLAAEPHFETMYVSPLRRALQTAEAAPPYLLCCSRILKSLAEIDCGRVDGVPIDDVRQRYPELWIENEAQASADFSWPGGESYRRFRKRVLRAVNVIARTHFGKRVLIVTHAGVINQVLGSISGQSAGYWEHPRPRNASLTQVVWCNSRGTVERFDDCSHIPRLY
jgi:broad specificity phosphatase PhoE